jgi:hypothetical protein
MPSWLLVKSSPLSAIQESIKPTGQYMSRHCRAVCSLSIASFRTVCVIFLLKKTVCVIYTTANTRDRLRLLFVIWMHDVAQIQHLYLVVAPLSKICHIGSAGSR